MNIICPRCGKENTIPFSDTKLKTTGFYCEDCKKDFFVDDGTIIKKHEEMLTDFKYQHTDKEGITYQVYIQKVGDKVTLSPSFIKDKMLTPYEAIDFSKDWEGFTKLLFEKIYLLDWNHNETGLITGKDESYQITLKYSLAAYPDDVFKGTDKFPPYLTVLNQIFSCFFVTE